MFLDFSRHKVFQLIIVLVILAAGLTGSVLLNQHYDLTGLGRFYLARVQALVEYYSHYNPTLIASAGARGAVAKSVPVLVYHGIPSEGQGVIPLTTFISHMRALKRGGWQTITLDQFTDFIKEGKSIPDKSFLLTFDDGRKDTYYPADPVLRDLGFSAVMFVITEFSLPDTPDKPSVFYLSKTELAQMAGSGRWELQSHGYADHRWYEIDGDKTIGHFLSNRIWLSGQKRLETEEEFVTRVTDDLTHSKEVLEKEFGRPVESFAFPFGDFGQDSQNFPQSKKILATIVPSIYTLSFYQTWSGNGDSFNYSDPNTSYVKRIGPASYWTGQELLEILEAGRAKTVPYEVEKFGRDWTSTWGSLALEETMKISAEAETSGGAVFLEGSYLWENYRYTAEVNWSGKGDVLLMAHYLNNDNYVACAFSTSRTVVQERIDGVTERVDGAEYKLTTVRANLPLSISVQGRKVACYIDNVLVAQGTVSTGAPLKGGIGMQVWSPVIGEAAVEATKITVK